MWVLQDKQMSTIQLHEGETYFHLSLVKPPALRLVRHIVEEVAWLHYCRGGLVTVGAAQRASVKDVWHVWHGTCV